MLLSISSSKPQRAIARPVSEREAQASALASPRLLARRVLIPEPHPTPASAARVLRGCWGRTWLLTGVLVLGILGAWECYWRQHGFQPSRVSDEPLWLMARERLASADKPVALLGASRLQAGFDLDVFAAQTGLTPAQLSICYSSPTPVLRHLADDESFRGLVLCDVTPLLFFQTAGPVVARAERYIDRYQRYTSLADRSEWVLQLGLESTLVTRLDRLAPGHFAECWLKGTAPEPNLGTLRADRMIVAHYPPGYGEKRPRRTTPFKRNPYLANAAERDALLADVARDVGRIRARGGEVVFLVLPFTGEYEEKERQLAPREQYWDVLLARTGAPGLYFEDVPGMNGYHCPDGCHLDSRDAPRFTRAVLVALQSQLAGTVWQFPTGANAAGVAISAAR